mmetsp:Transcript_19362/g.45130  ORF Transcript_19362/g.45130 Transcript_19362/m.45130 type:complete len:84 (+) Transcript_19362:143-394(+)|eukprot:CAMPEP_0178420740 /NCGR_PEP_ID=MMETSP0689_2-20121128/26287_1 /TAXON_ID=160604 /ORGANISM="Amphidinium massartii, Strain CS-259" /LENGTH=83 /DNA_ID=CAMNT_0020042229 /DNA_START=86 /DNA_END=337 /DNA_ORIENTATION=-
MDQVMLLIICLIVAFFIPPLGMWMWSKNCDLDVLLALLGMFLPPLGFIWVCIVVFVGSPLTGTGGVARGLDDIEEESEDLEKE